MDAGAAVRTRWEAIAPHFDERQRRLWACTEARSLGRGGISLVSRATGLSRQTLHTGMKDLDAPPATDGRIRRPGAGRKSLSERDPERGAAREAVMYRDVPGIP